jgi:hypothetical protein
VLLVGAHADRHQRPKLEILCGDAAGAQVAAKGTGDDGEHDVVDGAAELILYPLQLVELGVDPGKAPMGADLDVERRARRGEPGADELSGRAESVA